MKTDPMVEADFSHGEGEFFDWVDMPELSTLDEVRAFDAATCHSGRKVFIRKISMAEQREVPDQLREEVKLYNGVIIREVKPGVRTKVFVRNAVMIANDA